MDAGVDKLAGQEVLARLGREGLAHQLECPPSVGQLVQHASFHRLAFDKPAEEGLPLRRRGQVQPKCR